MAIAIPLASPEIPVKAFVASERGEAWLAERPAFVKLVGLFCVERKFPERVIREQCGFVGEGDHSQVWSFEGAALKVSTGTTGREANRQGYARPMKPENLIGQFRFLTALERHLDRQSDNIGVPAQYLAFHTPVGNIRVEQLMDGWTSLSMLASRQGYARTPQESEVNRMAQGRISAAIGRHSTLRLGLDLGLGEGGFRSDNVLAPQGVTVAGMETASLCIVDQPDSGYVGRLAVGLLAGRSRIAG